MINTILFELKRSPEKFKLKKRNPEKSKRKKRNLRKNKTDFIRPYASQPAAWTAMSVSSSRFSHGFAVLLNKYTKEYHFLLALYPNLSRAWKRKQMFKGEWLAGDAIKRLREVCVHFLLLQKRVQPFCHNVQTPATAGMLMLVNKIIARKDFSSKHLPKHYLIRFHLRNELPFSNKSCHWGSS